MVKKAGRVIDVQTSSIRVLHPQSLSQPTLHPHHPLAGVATIELIEGEPARFSHPLIGEPRRTLNDFGFPLKVQHGAFHQKPMVVLHSLRLSTLFSEAPAHFDNFELGGHLVKAVELKSKTNISMPLKIW